MANPIRRSVRLLLVGTVHLDPRGQHRLLGLLRDWKPEAIAIEVSPYAVQFRQSQGAGWRARLERFRLPDQSLPGGLDAVEAKLRLPFEYTAARAHARAANVPLHLLGDSERSRQLLDLLVAEMMTEENLERLSVPSEMGTLEERVEAEWRLAKRRFAGELRHDQTAEAGSLAGSPSGRLPAKPQHWAVASPPARQ